MRKSLFLSVLVILVVFLACDNSDSSGNHNSTEETFTITFNANGGEGGQVTPVTATYGEPMPALGAQAPTLDNYDFTGYFDALINGTRYYNADLSSAKNWDKKEAATLHAQWKAEGTLVINFDQNGGAGGPETVKAAYGESMPALGASAPTRGTTHPSGAPATGFFNGYNFSGYFDEPNGGVKYYNADLSSAKNWDKDDEISVLFAQWTPNVVIGQDDYLAPFAEAAPAIDGVGNDAVWDLAEWRDIRYAWMLEQPVLSTRLTAPKDASDFSGRYKIVWTAERLYVLAEITDDIRSVTWPNWNENPENNDCLELFVNENASGGSRIGNNFFTYHMSFDYAPGPKNVGDYADNGTGWINRKDHLNYMVVNTSGTLYTWEIEMKIFDDTYADNTEGTPITLYEGKRMGLAVAYCDADAANKREHFIGSMFIDGSKYNNDTNQGYRNADVYAKLLLVK